MACNPATLLHTDADLDAFLAAACTHEADPEPVILEM